MFPRRVLLVGLVLSACGNFHDDTTIDITHDVCRPIDLVTTTATVDQHAGIEDAIALWRQHGVDTLAVVETTGALEIRFEEAAPAFHGLYDDENGVIYINAGLRDRATLAIVVAHELGHSFGLPHVNDRRSVMNPGNLDVTPTGDDEQAVADLWHPCQ